MCSAGFGVFASPVSQVDGGLRTWPLNRRLLGLPCPQSQGKSEFQFGEFVLLSFRRSPSDGGRTMAER
jgi:hypothetical protein